MLLKSVTYGSGVNCYLCIRFVLCYGTGLQPLILEGKHTWGCRPRLVWNGPSALIGERRLAKGLTQGYVGQTFSRCYEREDCLMA